MTEVEARRNPRELRARAMLAAGARILETSTRGEYIIPSQSGNGLYRVKIVENAETCTCPDFEDRKAPCKHVFLVREWLAEEGNEQGSSASVTPFKRVRPNAIAFSKAQMEEGRLFPILLRELCAGISEPERDPHGAGRPPTPLRDQFFCAIQKVYTGFSARRSKINRVLAASQGHIENAPYFDVISKVLCREESTSILLDMVARSAFPFRAIESKCAVDSSGFRTTRFHYYRNEKYSPDRKNQWLKAHALVGIRTHAVLAIEVTAGNVGDSPQFPLLLERAARAGFDLKEATADKAYNARANFEIAKELGIQAYIPFKSNQTGQSRGSKAYHDAFLFFAYHRDKFDEHYRQRGQVEVTFGAWKQVVGETIASRKFTAQVNELLCRTIAYNITMLIHAMFAIGLLPDFLEPSERPQTNLPIENPTPEPGLLSFNPLEAAPSVVLSPPPR